MIVAGLASGCLFGRNLYYVDDAPAEQDVTATTTDPDGGPTRGRADDAAPSHAADGGGTTTDPTVTDASVKKDSAPDAQPSPTCMGGTVEREPNDAVPSASELAIGKTCGNLTLGDTDWFTYNVGDVGALHLTFVADGDAKLLIQGAGGGIAFVTGSGGAFNLNTSGVWNLRVLSDTGRAQGYTLNRPAP